MLSFARYEELRRYQKTEQIGYQKIETKFITY